MNRGKIILIPFYFTDFRGYKFRPALVVSSNQSQSVNLIVAFISTILPAKDSIHPTHLIINKSEPYFFETGLHTTSIVKCDKLMTINKSIIEGLLGEVTLDILRMIEKKLKIALSLQ